MSTPVHAYAYNPTPLAKFLRKARTQRVAIISIENSNGQFNTASAGGRIRAQRNAFAAAGLTAWATHLMTMNGYWGQSGYPVTTGFTPTMDDHFREAPAVTVNNWMAPAVVGAAPLLPVDAVHAWGRAPDKNMVSPWNSTIAGLYALGTAGVNITAASCNGGVTMTPTVLPGLMDWSANLRVHFWHSARTPTGGTFRPVVRRAPSSTIVAEAPSNITVAAGTPTITDMTRYVLNVPAGSRAADTSMSCRWAGGYAPTGSLYLSYILVEQADRNTGIAYGLYWSVGGTSIADFVWACTDGALEETFTISAISAAAAPEITISPAHGFTDHAFTPDTEVVLLSNTNSTPTVNGLWTIEVTATDRFTLVAAPGTGPAAVPTTTVAGTSGTVTRFIRPLSLHAMVHANQALMYPIIDKEQDPVVCFRICDVLNMRNEVIVSTAYGDVADSRDAYKTALRAAIATCIRGWMATWLTDGNGADIHTKMENVCIWVDPDHPPAASDAEIADYIQAAAEVANEFPDLVTVTRIDQIVTHAELLAGTGGGGANSYYQSSGTDTNHLTAAGYKFVEDRKVAAMLQLPVIETNSRLRQR